MKYRVSRHESVVVEADDEAEARAVGEEILSSPFGVTPIYSDVQVEELISDDA